MKKVITLIAALLVVMLGVLTVSAEEAETKLENVALDKMVYAETTVENDVASLEGAGWFSAAWLTDGEVPVWGGPEDLETHICWYGGSVKRETDIMLTIELEKDYNITEIRVYPTTFLQGANMPSIYEVLISSDAENWTVVATEKGIVDGRQYSDPFVYEVNQTASYVGIHVLKASNVKDQDYYYSGLGEVEVIAAVPVKTPAPTGAPTAAPTEAPAEATEAAVVTDAPGDATAETSETGSKGINTGLLIGIIAAVVVAAAVVAGVIIANKKKK